MRKEKPKLDGKDFVIGRIVHYLDGVRSQFPAILTECKKVTTGIQPACLVVFDSSGGAYKRNVPYDSRKNPETWHWPSRELRGKKKQRAAVPGQPLRPPAAKSST